MLKRAGSCRLYGHLKVSHLVSCTVSCRSLGNKIWYQIFKNMRNKVFSTASKCLKNVRTSCYCTFREILVRTFLKFHSPMPYFHLRPEFIAVLLPSYLTKLKLFVIILNCVRISDSPQQTQVVNAVLFTLRVDYLILVVDPDIKWYVIPMQTATTGLICLKQFESTVLFSPIFNFYVCYLCLD